MASLRADLANCPVDIPRERARIGGSGPLLQLVDEQAKLQLRGDHESQKLQAFFWFQGLDPLGQISNLE